MFHRIFSLVIVLTIAVSAAAAPPAPFVILKQTLGLADEQLLALQQLLEARRAAVEPIVAEIAPLEQQLEAALNSESPDATKVGTLVVSIRSLQRRIAAHNENFQHSFEAILTPQQRAQLDTIRGVEASLHAAEALHAIGF